MTDIVERLRRYAHPNSWAHDLPILTEAADEIEQLRKQQQCGSRQMAMADLIGDCSFCNGLLRELGELRIEIERLRKEKFTNSVALMREATAEIEQLRAENERLRASLVALAHASCGGS